MVSVDVICYIIYFLLVDRLYMIFEIIFQLKWMIEKTGLSYRRKKIYNRINLPDICSQI